MLRRLSCLDKTINDQNISNQTKYKIWGVGRRTTPSVRKVTGSGLRKKEKKEKEHLAKPGL